MDTKKTGLRCPLIAASSYIIESSILANKMEKNMKNEMETWFIGVYKVLEGLYTELLLRNLDELTKTWAHSK